MERSVLVSMSYFTIATELRLLACKDEVEGKEESQERIESECYHLLAIVVMLHFVPFDLLYLQHILASYETHYQHPLTPQHYCELTPTELIDRLTPTPSPSHHSS